MFRHPHSPAIGPVSQPLLPQQPLADATAGIVVAATTRASALAMRSPTLKAFLVFIAVSSSERAVSGRTHSDACWTVVAPYPPINARTTVLSAKNGLAVRTHALRR